MKRRATDAQCRDIIRARMTKGDAFRIVAQDEYNKRQADVTEQLSKLTRAELFKKYAAYLYDVKN